MFVTLGLFGAYEKVLRLGAHNEIHLGVTLRQKQELSDLRGDSVGLGSPRKAAGPDFALGY